MESPQIKLWHPASQLVQLPEGYKDYFIKVKGSKGSYIAKGTLPNSNHGWNQSPGVLSVENEI